MSRKEELETFINKVIFQIGHATKYTAFDAKNPVLVVLNKVGQTTIKKVLGKMNELQAYQDEYEAILLKEKKEKCKTINKNS